MFKELSKGVNAVVRQERIWKAYLFVLNESLAMQLDLKDLLKDLENIDNQLLELKEVVKK